MTDISAPDAPDAGDVWNAQILRAPLWFGRVVMAIALVVLAGWSLGEIEILVRMRTDLAAMAPTTALCFALLALALILHDKRIPHYTTVPLFAVFGIVALEGALVFLQMPSATQLLGFERGSMSLATQLCMAIAGTSLSAMIAPSATLRQIGGWLATFGLFTALIALVGYALDTRALYSVFVFSEMALHTAATFLLLFLGILFLHPQDTWLTHLLGHSRASRSARRLFAVGFFSPLLIGFVAQRATEAGLLDESVRLSAFSLALSLMAVTLILTMTARANAAEFADAAQEIRLQSLLDGIGASVFAVEEDGTLRYANTQARTLSAAIGDPTEWLREAVFLHSDQVTPLHWANRPLQRLLRNEGTGDFQVGYAPPDGPARILRFLPGSYRDTRGARIFTLTCRDVTDAARARADHNRAERLDSLGQLSGGIAHDIANLLGVIRLNADVGEMRGSGAEAQFAAIQSACDRGADLTSRILAFAARQPGRPEVVTLNRALKEAHSFLSRTIEATVTLKLDLPDTPIRVVTDRGLLENVIVNLVLNARDALIEAKAEDARITISLRANGKGALLAVDDNGPGIPQQIRDRVRDPFFTTRQARGGTGLGLAIVDTFARNNGATLRLERSVAGGARIELDFDQRATAEEDNPLDQIGSAERLDDLRILVVEDDPLFSVALRDLLEALGAEVSLALTGPEALTVLQGETPFDLLLTDITLRGGMNGFAVAREARSLRPDLPRIYLSGYTQTDSGTASRPPGRFLQKPIGAARLTKAIRETMEAKESAKK